MFCNDIKCNEFSLLTNEKLKKKQPENNFMVNDKWIEKFY